MTWLTLSGLLFGVAVGNLVYARVQARRLREALALVREHHAVGVLDNMRVGDQCPVCERWKESHG